MSLQVDKTVKKKKKHRRCVILSFIPVHEGQCAWPSSECVTLFCALQVVSSDLFNSISIFKAKQKKKNGQTKKNNESFWWITQFLLNLIHVNPCLKRRRFIYNKYPFTIKCSMVYLPVQLCSGTLSLYPSLQTHLKDPLVLWHNELVALQLCFPDSHSFMSAN